MLYIYPNIINFRKKLNLSSMKVKKCADKFSAFRVET